MEQRSLMEPSMYVLKGLVILDSTGQRVLAKYWDRSRLASLAEQRKLEADLHSKACGRTQQEDGASEVMLLGGGYAVLHKPSVDLHFFVLGEARENVVLLASVLDCFFESVNKILRRRGEVDQASLYDNLDTVMLAMDEICDNGVLMESDPAGVVSALNLEESSSAASLGQILMQQSMAQVIQSAKQQIKWPVISKS